MKSKLENNSVMLKENEKVNKKLIYSKELIKKMQEQLFSYKNELEMCRNLKNQGVSDDIFELKSKYFESEQRNKHLLKDITALKAQVQNQSNSLYNYENHNPIHNALENCF